MQIKYAHIYVVTDGRKVTADLCLSDTCNPFARAELHSSYNSKEEATATANNLGDKSPTYYYDTLIPQIKLS